MRQTAHTDTEDTHQGSSLQHTPGDYFAAPHRQRLPRAGIDSGSRTAETQCESGPQPPKVEAGLAAARAELIREQSTSSASQTRTDSDPLAMYLTEIAQVPLLTAAQEAKLGRLIRRGQRASRELSERLLLTDSDAILRAKLERAVAEGELARVHLIRANLRLVVSIAKRYASSHALLGDLIQEGNFGLMRAAEKFDYRRGFKFSTYATWWIRQAINRSVTEHSRTIRLPAHMADQVRRYMRCLTELQQVLGREPTTEELAIAMGLVSEADQEAAALARRQGEPLDPDLRVELRHACARVEQLAQIAQDPLSLEAPVGEDGGTVVGDFVSDNQAVGLVESASRALLEDHLRDVLGELSDREREVLEMRFGLNGEPARTLEDIGVSIGVSRERVRQIECRALRKLRQPSRSNRLRDYLS